MPLSIRLDNTVPGTWAGKDPSCGHQKRVVLFRSVDEHHQRALASVDIHAMQDISPCACASPRVCLSNGLPQGSYAILKVFPIPVWQTKPLKRKHHNASGL